MSLLVAADARTPGPSVGVVASPFDFTQVPLVAPLRPLVNIAGGAGTSPTGLLGGAPAPLVRRAYQLAGFDKYVMKPITLRTNLDDRDFLAQVEAVDAFMAAHARLPRSHVRPALSPHAASQRPRGRGGSSSAAARSRSRT